MAKKNVLILCTFCILASILVSQVQSQSCPKKCRSCKSWSRCTGCKNGYYSGRYRDQPRRKYYRNCRFKCRTRCKVCTSYNKCTECKPGYHGTKCQNRCPATCTTCVTPSGRNTECLICKTGHYGLQCRYNCSSKCVGRKCSINGTCLICNGNYFGNHCQHRCPVGCLNCSSLNFCSSCVHGYYGNTCENKCSNNCKDKMCIRESGMCRKGCLDGFYGRYCNETCPINCTKCTSPVSCKACIKWHKGRKCEQECVNCKYGTSCQQNSGYCYGGCANGKSGWNCDKDCMLDCKSCYRYFINRCLECSQGRFGRYGRTNWYRCDKACSTNCLNKTCDGDSGHCTHDCVTGYKGDTCICPINCICNNPNNPGKCQTCMKSFGNANKNCECRRDMCHIGDGSCASCKDKTWYPDSLSGTCCRCSQNCKYSECSSDNQCTEGCGDGYFGRGCDKLCSSIDRHCVKCETMDTGYGRCSGCKTGYFPTVGTTNVSKCDVCSRSCLNGNCNSSSGNCIDGCNNRLWGEKCERRCNTQCLDSVCDRQNGHCSKGCLGNKYGHFCENECGRQCESDHPNATRCFPENGTCIFDCLSGYHGDMCNRVCGSNCRNDTCKRLTGECILGCKDGYKGSMCTQEALEGHDDDLGDGAVVGGSVGGVMSLVLVAVVVIVVLRKRRNGKAAVEYSAQYNANDVTQNNPRVGDPGPIYNNNLESVTLYSSVKRPGESTAPVYSIPNFGRPREQLRMSTQSVISTEEVDEKVGRPREQLRMSTQSVISTGRPREQLRLSTQSVISTEEIDEEDEADIVPTRPNLAADKIYCNITRRVHVDKLAEYVAKKQTDDFKVEFKDFHHGLAEGISYADSQKRENVSRNRYRSIYPYDTHRVRLTGKGTDYINASYLDGYCEQKAYIACLGPTEKTTENFVTFWRMVWQTRAEIIVMVTNLFDNGSNKCDQYWPNAGSRLSYGDITVTCHGEDIYADYTVRCFSVSSIFEDTRSLNHIHYTAWPDKGVPDDVTSLIEFRQKVIRTPKSLGGPTIVHCSAGVGRTGTYIALDVLTMEGEQQKTVDIFGCVEHMREHRVYMVQTAEQYKYLHFALVHTLTFDSHAIPSETFQEYYMSLNDSQMAKKFEQLQSTTKETTEQERKAINRNKTQTKCNRRNADIPGDRHRPKLSPRQPGLSDYINAVYVNSFKTKNCFLVAQTPLPGTVLDFVSLIYQTNCSCIVSMEPLEHLKDRTVGTYFRADQHELNVGPFKITSTKGEPAPQYILRKVTIDQPGPRGSDERTIHHYQYTQWQPGHLIPDSPTALLEMVQGVNKKTHASAAEGPIIIHCMNGGEKSGLFCVVTMLIEKMEIEHEVSVVNCIRMVKSRRRAAIPNKEQLSFCYQCVSTYLESFDTYSNFALRT